MLNRDFTVRQNATLYVEGATVDGELVAHRPQGIDMENGITVGRRLTINRIQGVPAGEPANEFCNLNVGDVHITSAARRLRLM